MHHGFTLITVFVVLIISTCFGAVPLVDFQVAQPPPVPQGAKTCTIELFQRDFGNSFGDPEVVEYQPPTDCGEVGSWAAVTLNFTVTSNGTQFDRLGIFTFQDVEIWRTSTPEPSLTGIIWTYIKDVTRFIPLLAEEGRLILQLDNLLETGLNGVYSTTLQATFFASSPSVPPAEQADVIIPISAASAATNNSADASVSPAFSVDITIPQNAISAYAELYASGNGNEEFWYFNAPNAFLHDLPSGFTFGDGPFREVRLIIDGKVAGTAFPYPVVFTGGILPTAWRPITSYGALDLPTYVLDVTPFLPLLTDGGAHNFTLDVISAETNGAINQNWFVSGLLQVVTSSTGTPTTGNMTVYEATEFPVSTATASVTSNGDVTITVTASRTIHIESDVCSGEACTTVVFDQSLDYSNVQTYLNNFNIQNVLQTATGTVTSTHNGVTALKDDYSYPFAVNITSLNNNGSMFEAVFDHSYNRNLLPAPFILGSTIQERQIAGGFFEESSAGNTGNGTSNNTFSYVDTAGNTFSRTVRAALNNITFDVVSGSLANSEEGVVSQTFPFQQTKFAGVRMPGGRTVGS
ncbi:peptide N-acetyl-beta-D-glucosaminyl asparaginase amidase A-domain-containing protein [Lentinula raphanica]|uniref:Peptide N-acetyl-beta-D-glucosaminyl asparaginase amidase A-domain-containing protein n=1 Tax=Lentinula raphanica TaxID=153919 RepID=A0AA38UKU0_9AGAR|nr:peptide N-acetyl-beta-D-glucosaminyl asparaginase amidase A-domain-containing protein [Lentinula raphanica]KAJ3827955.1 peptide N-acetyl-beta-D-glucosaminyl asparaginase amidase A-domain-containing protein [Lentinula raphanica]KAJ3845055.1 peptide N-acetyl-beta-D-glucosaminyl asparaginase amidase A-domain-containing protein [Lentinula raphanica]KAJ3977735.1 peptide N-acetyl-beta-D-glucosaminyl asparaginase amidase A-domain-containing protein [Lentinula raphanica]